MGFAQSRQLVGRVLLAGLAGTLVIGCSAIGIGGNAPTAGQNPGARPGTTVSVVKVVEGPITQAVAYSGSVQSGDSVSLVPKTAGRITKLGVDVGSTVKAGDVVAELDHSSLDALVVQAQAGVDAAQVKLDQMQAGARPETVAIAEANARAAKARADAVAGGGRDEAVAQAQANLDSARAKLGAVQSGPRSETVAQAKANLDAARAKLAAMQNGPRPETVAQSKANVDTAVSKLNQLKNGPTPEQIAAGQLSVQQAQNSLFSAQVSRDGNCNPKNPAFQCQSAQATVNASATALNIATQNLKILTSPPTQEALNQAQLAVDQANQAYKLAQQPNTTYDIAQLQDAVTTAEQVYKLTQQPNTAYDVAQLQDAVTVAAQAYKLAQQPNTSFDVTQAQAQSDAAAQQAKLAASPFTDLDLKAARVTVEQAQAALAIARSGLADSQIVAPFDGVISAKFLSLGALASPATPIVTVMSPRLQVQFSVEEGRIGNIKTDQAAVLTTSAFPDRTFPAKVASIYPAADPKTHTFTVVVEPENPDGSLRAGMFVELKVILASRDKATLASRAAIVQKGAQQVIFAVANGKAQMRAVTLGLSDDQNVEVVKGLSVGEDIVTAGQASLNDGDPVRVAGTGAPTAGAGTPAGGGARPASGTPRPIVVGATPAEAGATPTATAAG